MLESKVPEVVPVGWLAPANENLFVLGCALLAPVVCCLDMVDWELGFPVVEVDTEDGLTNWGCCCCCWSRLFPKLFGLNLVEPEVDPSSWFACPNDDGCAGGAGAGGGGDATANWLPLFDFLLAGSCSTPPGTTESMSGFVGAGWLTTN